MSSITPMTRKRQHGSGQIAQRTALTADQALAAAFKAETERNAGARSSFRCCSVSEPPYLAHANFSRRQRQHCHRDHGRPQRTNLTGDGAATGRPRSAPGFGGFTKAAHSGPVWAIVVTLTGIFPTIFAVTGIIMWLRKRSDRKELAGKRCQTAAYVQPSDLVVLELGQAERIERSMTFNRHEVPRHRGGHAVAVILVLPATPVLRANGARRPGASTVNREFTPHLRSSDPAAVRHAQPPAATQAPNLPDIVLKLPRDLSPWGMFMAADIVVKAVMVGLVFASVLTWTIWFAKAIELMIARRRMRSGNRGTRARRARGAKRTSRMKGRDSRRRRAAARSGCRAASVGRCACRRPA